MSEYTAKLIWERGEQDFLRGRYSRVHQISFDGGLQIAGSASPQVIRAPWSDPAALDPEEAFVASLSSCHMLWFLALAAKSGFCVDRYEDNPVGQMGPNAAGKIAVTLVTLKPAITVSGVTLPSAEQIDALHHEAHEVCYIANSVTTEVRVEAVR